MQTFRTRTILACQSGIQGIATGLENYAFLTPGMEIKKANLYGASTGAVLVRFSNAATVNVTWSTNGLVGDRRIVSSKRTSGPEPISGLRGIQFSMSVNARFLHPTV